MKGDELPLKWVELRRYNDPLEADMARDFLQQNGVRVSVRGNSGITGVLNRFDTILDIRLVVPEAELATAEEALGAMQSPARNEAPFRGFGHEKEVRGSRDEDDDLAKIPEKKSAFSAVGVALMVPIGAGHTYAEHRAAGQIFGMAIGASAIVALLGGVTWLWIAVMVMVMTDALLSPLAVKRFNARQIPAVERQRAWAGAAVLTALGLAYFCAR